jgi:hypothetical protein
MADWLLRFQTRTGTYIGETPFFDLQGEFRKNQPDEIRFKVSSQELIKYVDPVTQIEAGVTEVMLLRNNIPVFLGPIWTITAGSKEKYLNCMAQDISSYFKQRIVAADTKFTKKRYAYGAWKLIQDSQALSYGDLGITLGQDAPTNPTGSWSYTRKSGTKIYDAIDKLSQGANGFDWEINTSRQLMLYYPRIQTPSNIILEYGAGGAIRTYSVQQIGTYAANEVFVRGGGKIVSSTYSDTPSKIKFGLRHWVGSDSSMKSKAKVDAFARSQLTLRKNPRAIPSIVVDTERLNPFEDGVGYGTLFNTTISDGWVQFQGTMRCSGFQLTIGKSGQETFVVYVNDTREIEDVG